LDPRLRGDDLTVETYSLMFAAFTIRA
jgi:hypothetical protein